jgi:hypothetical protein
MRQIKSRELPMPIRPPCLKGEKEMICDVCGCLEEDCECEIDIEDEDYGRDDNWFHDPDMEDR